MPQKVDCSGLLATLGSLLTTVVYVAGRNDWAGQKPVGSP